ncbi:uncharacterized protein F4817DRAFT_322712 [Daldinia loculata]|uniref:uncharacterized protein n=1 Tax=Daldinia loculata TaxID=103429 RepID=UPI0020C3C3B2|nr:uncharacterized protein F4817DRAFT_322712 [Daldinia loculata]KAI1652270.1 hypothetical protein F4817DRAFT_322712 [Daldinia loculata]
MSSQSASTASNLALEDRRIYGFGPDHRMPHSCPSCLGTPGHILGLMIVMIVTGPVLCGTPVRTVFTKERRNNRHHPVDPLRRVLRYHRMTGKVESNYCLRWSILRTYSCTVSSRSSIKEKASTGNINKYVVPWMEITGT